MLYQSTFRSGDDAEPASDSPDDVDGAEGAESEDELTEDEDSQGCYTVTFIHSHPISIEFLTYNSSLVHKIYISIQIISGGL